MVAAIAGMYRKEDWTEAVWGSAQVLLVTRLAAVARNFASHLFAPLEAVVSVVSSEKTGDAEEGSG
jgi:hypothetical protein